MDERSAQQLSRRLRETDDDAMTDYTCCGYRSEHDALQTVGDHESHNDSAYFNLVPLDSARIVGAVLRVGMRPNEGYSEASVVMPRGDGTVVFQYLRSALSSEDFAVGSSRWESGPLRLEATEPTRRWRLWLAGGDARLVTDPHRFAAEPGKVWRASSSLRCEFDLEWKAEFPIHVLSEAGNLMPGDEEIAYGKNHYEQFGRVRGAFSLGDEEWVIEDVPSFRDHSWGPRIWESAPDQDFVTAYLDDGRRVVAIANRSNRRADAHGVIWRPGATTPGHLDRYQLRSDYAGEAGPGERIGWFFAGDSETIEISGDVVGFMPLRVGKKPVRIAQTIVRLTGDNPGRAKTDLTRPIAGA